MKYEKKYELLNKAVLTTAAVSALLAVLAGCALLDLFSSVKFNTIIEDKIEYSDEHSNDSNSSMFCWDCYKVTLKTGKSYSLELWTDPTVPIHFECDDLGQDLGAWSDGDHT